jgi:cell fate regulator YaaT (PSP1 superfamily)
MNVFDWLSNMEIPGVDRQFDVVEVRFKGGRKEFFRNVENILLSTGDPIIVDVPNGHHLGFVSLQGELVRLQMLKKGVKNNGEIRSIYRVATAKDLEKYEQAQDRDASTLFRTRNIIKELKLDMKLSDVEFQADNTKATFYYSAEERVDFRELIKVLAGEFKIRVEMKQISLRQEAGRLGGIGVCGRELCCSTWLSDFKSVSTAAARYQNLSLNPSKLSGQCGRLKCCLNYELETYMDALKDIPTIHAPLLTNKGVATLQKTDIFKKIMWFGYDTESNWYPVPVEKVNEILEMNRKGIKPESLDVMQIEKDQELKGPAPLNEDLALMDQKYSKKPTEGKKKKKKKKKPGTEKMAQGDQTGPVKAQQPKSAQGDQTGHVKAQQPKPAQHNQHNRPRRNANVTPTKS